MPNPFCHIELNTHDVPAAKDFYTRLFDWTIEAAPGMDYNFIKPGAGPGGGMMQHPMPGAPPSWLAYVGVDDIYASAAKAKELGAKILVGPNEVPGHGHLCIFTDPTGATLALWQALTPTTA